ncbi:MAG: MgtC/SapB family protein [Treponemataceae bacterium]|nr:MgtC/SapB family protein [Treponemataceae bacterium]
MFTSLWEEFIRDSQVATFSTYLIILFKLLISFIEGLIIGIERKMRQQAIGMRTLILISVASTLLMILSIYLGKCFGGDSARLAAQVVSGIGFLGGGAIMRQGLNIRGLTSAATIWGAAALGLAVGAGLYIPSFIALGFFMIALIVLEKIESRYFPAERTKILTVTFKNEDINYQELHNVVENHGLIILSSDIDHRINEGRLEIKFSVRTPEDFDVLSLSHDIKALGKLEEFILSF